MKRDGLGPSEMEGGGRGWLILPGLLATAILLVIATPACLPLAWTFDRIGGSGRSWCAGWLTLLALVGIELLVVARATGLWFTCGGPWRAREEGFEAHGRLLRWWAASTLRVIVRLNGMRVEVEGLDEVDLGRSHILFIRHVSVLDTLLPRATFSAVTGVEVLEVWKRELLWIPSLHFVARRLPHVVVSREDGSSAEVVNQVAALAANLTGGEGLAVFPEGARFSPARRTHVLRHLEGAGRADRAEEARALRHVLPVRTGSTRALMDRRGDADVWFLGHAGFDAIFSFSDLFRGGLRGVTLRLRFWRHAGSDVPGDPDEAVAWVRARWRDLDEWLNQSKMRALAGNDPGADGGGVSDPGSEG
jgi:1-acyl-sn-glycerol-3-phosphate acyltransferase